MTRLEEKAGAVHEKSTATQTVKLSSFGSELDAATTAIKTISRISNILKDMGFIQDGVPILYSDNEAMINFVKGEGVAKGVRHMELCMWYTREQYKQGDMNIKYMPGVDIPPDKFTKLANKKDHQEFRNNVQGLELLGSSIVTDA